MCTSEVCQSKPRFDRTSTSNTSVKDADTRMETHVTMEMMLHFLACLKYFAALLSLVRLAFSALSAFSAW